jgi:hypothetical protein
MVSLLHFDPAILAGICTDLTTNATLGYEYGHQPATSHQPPTTIAPFPMAMMMAAFSDFDGNSANTSVTDDCDCPSNSDDDHNSNNGY